MVKQKSIKLVIFDFDGTLVKLDLVVDNIRKELTTYFKKFGLDLYVRPIYPKIFEALEKLGEKHTKEEIEKIRKEAYSLMEKEELKSFNDTEPVLGAKKILDQLKGGNLKIAIVSVNGRKIIKKTFREFNFIIPDLIVSRDDLGVVKPDSKVGQHILKHFRIKPKEAILIGDSDYDMELASKLGIKSVWLRSEKQLTYTKPDFTIDKLKEVLEFV